MLYHFLIVLPTPTLPQPLPYIYTNTQHHDAGLEAIFEDKATGDVYVVQEAVKLRYSAKAPSSPAADSTSTATAAASKATSLATSSSSSSSSSSSAVSSSITTSSNSSSLPPNPPTSNLPVRRHQRQRRLSGSNPNPNPRNDDDDDNVLPSSTSWHAMVSECMLLYTCFRYTICNPSTYLASILWPVPIISHYSSW